MPATSSQDLIDRLRACAARLGVIGLRHIGVPLAVDPRLTHVQQPARI